jgi:hypothetical protein
MRSDKQNEASRTNGAKSNGPVTPEGKAASSRNAERHNLCPTGHLVLLANEDPDEFRQIQDDFIVRFYPVDGVELDLVHKLIAATWREKRITGMETALFELEMLRQKEEIEEEYLEISPSARQALALFGTDDTKAAAALLFRYASTARRAYAGALKALKELQGDRFNRRSRLAPLPDRPPISDPTESDNAVSAEDAKPEPAVAACQRPAIASFIFLRRRLANHLAQAKNNELPNEPKRAFAAGAGTAFAYEAA